MFFPSLTNSETAILQTRAKPVDGNLVIVQGEYAIVSPDDPDVNRIGTFAISSCRGALIVDKKRGHSGVAHVDFDFQESVAIGAMRRNLVQAGSDPSNLVLRTTNNLNPLIIDSLRSEFGAVITDLPRDFLYDVKHKTLEGLEENATLKSGNINERVGQKQEIRFKHCLLQARRVY